jgi:VCBS repeat-containing protein
MPTSPTTTSPTTATGSSGSDVLIASSSGSTISAGSGNDTLYGGAGSDRLSGDSGDDLFYYNITQNSAGTTDVYTGGSGIDTVLIQYTLAQWLDATNQQQITAYLAHLQNVTNATTGQVSNGSASDFTFHFGSSTLTLQMMEHLRVTVDGVELDPANALVAAHTDSASGVEDGPAVTIDVLANDSVPDLVKDLALATNPAHGSVTLVKPNPSNPATWCFNFQADNSYYQYLAAGETATDSFSYTVTDANGDTGTATVVLTITGTNDAPTISAAVDTGTVAEDASPVTLAATGTITFDDIDLADSHTVSATADAGNTLGGTLAPTVTHAATGAGDGTVTWTYNVANAATQYLAQDQVATEKFVVTISDGQGGTASRTITITVTGVNDAPTISASVSEGAVTEDNVPVMLTSTGTVTFDDVDLTDGHTVSASAQAGNTLGGTLAASVTHAATGAGNGTVTWNYSVANAATQYLAAGETATESFNLTIADGHGGTVSQVVTVTVTGTNDDPTISAAIDTGAATEDDAPTSLTASGTVTFDDVDLADTHTVSATSDAANTLGGTLTPTITDPATGAGDGTVTWNYSVANSATQYLAQGETATEKFSVTIADGHGGTASQLVTVTVTGTNDAPTISAAVDTGAVAEDDTPTALTTSGTITFDDVDLADSHTVSATPDAGNTLGGTLTPTVTDPATGAGDGTVTWNYSVANAATQYLAEGQTATEKFEVAIADGRGGTVSQLVTVTVTGTNDAPTISAAQETGTVTEDDDPTTLTTSGTITFDDVDLADSHTASATADSGNTLGGTLTPIITHAATGAGDGTVTWHYSVANAAAQYLAAGETATEKFVVTISDGHGGTVSRTVTVMVDGANDPPTISAVVNTGAVTEDDAPTTLTTGGTITFDDVDLSDSHTVLATADAGNTLGGTLAPSITTAATGAGDGTVAWNYSVANSAVQYLAQGETASEKFNVTIADGHGGTVSQLVTVTVMGTNDAPTISAAVDTGALTEDSSPATLTATGTVTFDDVDLADSHTVAATPDAANTLGGTLTANVTHAATGAGDGTVTWNYGVANSAAQYLAEGETATEKFTLTIGDGQGGTVSQLVTVTVTGTNDDPTISAAIDTGAVNEDDAPTTLTAGGTITFDDLDLADSHTVSATADAGNTLGGTLTPTITTAATGAGDGIVTWNYSVANAATQYLAAGETATEKFEVTIADGHGGTVSQLVTVTVTGANDDPTISAAVDTGAVNEDDSPTTLTAGGTITFDDLDLADSHTVSATADAANMLGGTLAPVVTDAATGAGNGTVTWTYNVANSATQYLAQGETATEKFSVTIADGHGGTASQLVTVTITGTNDAPTISAAIDTGAVTEDDAAVTLTTSGTITFDDVDLADGHTVSATADSGNTLGGTLTPSITDPATGSGDGTVTWNYSLANAAAQYLAAGETATERFDVTVADGHGGTASQIVTVTITGSNDAPTISAAVDTGAVMEDDAPNTLTASGTITFDDVDLVDSHTVSATADVGNTLGGSLAATVTDAATGIGDGTVTWSYSIADTATQTLAQGETATEKFNVTISDGQGGTVSRLVTVTVTGANDAPTISTAIASGGVTEDDASTTLTTAGTITFDDLDLADSHTVSATADAGNTLGGTLTPVVTDPASGSGDGTVTWNYSVANAATQYLAAGETVSEKFNVTISDGHGGTVSQPVTVIVTGTNDAPTISAAVATGSVTEDSAPTTLTTNGTITFDDIDLSDAHSTSVTPAMGNALGGTLTASVTTPASGPGAGTVSWTYNVSNAAVQSLGTGQSASETFTVAIADGQGGTVNQTVTVTVNGVDEPAVGPTGGPDAVITSVALGTAFAIPEWALLANDSLTGGGALDVAAVSGASGLSVTHTPGTGSNGSVTVTDAAPAGGSFNYTPTDGTANGAATTVTVTQDAAGSLDGTSGSEILVGGGNGTTINGGAGDDIEIGGGSNDTYVFGLADGKDVIADAGGGNDAIQITTSPPTDSTALSTLNFEQVGNDLVIKVGSSQITVRDHFVAGTIESITFTNGATFAGYAIGTTAYKIGTTLGGTGQEDVIASSTAGQALSGGNGNDLLFGNGGNDTITGGNGNDLLVGGDGNDRLIGSTGNDVLLGGLGSDTFVFNTAPNASTNVDLVGDFDANGVDHIELSAGVFTGIATGANLAAADFASVSGTGATATVGAGVNIIYDSASGNLYYDSDGGGGANRTLFATVTLTGGVFDNLDITVTP